MSPLLRLFEAIIFMIPIGSSLRTIFQGIFQKNYNGLCRHAYNYLRDREAAEDIVQDVFVKIWEDRPEIFLEKAVVSYLYTSVRNNCISVLRKKVIFVSDESEDGILSNIIIEDTPVDEEAHTSLYNSIMEAIDQLPPKCSAVFKMHKLMGLSYKQIAEELSISVKTVENQIGKALKIIRKEIRP